MKTKLRTMLLAAAGVLGSVAVAQAQPAPGPAPAPVDPNAPALAPAVAPAAMPAAPPSVAPAPVNWGGAPPPADTVEKEAVKKPNPFGFTRFTWANSASTKIFGIGDDYNSTDDESYTMDFGLNIRYSFLNQPKSKAYVNVAGGVEVELTNSDTTTKKHEPLLRDTSVGVGFSQAFFESADKETRTTWIISAGGSLPTSKASQNTGRFFGTSLTTGIVHGQKLAGSKNEWFPDVLFFGTVNWGHTFSRATTATNESFVVSQRPRQVECSGNDCLTDVSDQLSGGSFTHDRLKLNLTGYLSIYKDILSIGNSWELEERFKYKPAAVDCVQTSTGCTPLQAGNSPTNRNVGTTFDVSVSYAIPQNLGRVDLGYANTTGQLAENGSYRSVFYSPEAQFYMNLVAYLDGIYDKASSKPDPKAKQRVGALPRFSSTTR